MRSLIRSCAFVALAALAVGVAAAPAEAPVSNKWRIACDSDADGDGVVVFEATPQGGAAIQVRVELAKDTGENAVARHIRDAFRTQARDRFHVETDDGEDVLVKKLRGQPDFGLEIVEQTVTGVRFHLRRE